MHLQIDVISSDKARKWSDIVVTSFPPERDCHDFKVLFVHCFVEGMGSSPNCSHFWLFLADLAYDFVFCAETEDPTPAVL